MPNPGQRAKWRLVSLAVDAGEFVGGCALDEGIWGFVNVCSAPGPPALHARHDHGPARPEFLHIASPAFAHRAGSRPLVLIGQRIGGVEVAAWIVTRRDANLRTHPLAGLRGPLDRRRRRSSFGAAAAGAAAVASTTAQANVTTIPFMANTLAHRRGSVNPAEALRLRAGGMARTAMLRSGSGSSVAAIVESRVGRVGAFAQAMTDNSLPDPLAWAPLLAPSLAEFEVIAAAAFRRLPARFRANAKAWWFASRTIRQPRFLTR